jgi:hypothetical protein
VREKTIEKYEGRDLFQFYRHDSLPKLHAIITTLKLICRGGKPWDTWKIDDNLEFSTCLGYYHEHLDFQIHLSIQIL